MGAISRVPPGEEQAQVLGGFCASACTSQTSCLLAAQRFDLEDRDRERNGGPIIPEELGPAAPLRCARVTPGWGDAGGIHPRALLELAEGLTEPLPITDQQFW